MSRDRHLERVEPFTALHPVSRPQLVVRVILGPLLWLVALVVAAIVLHRIYAIEVGILVAFVSLVVSLLVLLLLRGGRNRERERFADRR
jgi:Flp pilus assembly protein TadB